MLIFFYILQEVLYTCKQIQVVLPHPFTQNVAHCTHNFARCFFFHYILKLFPYLYIKRLHSLGLHSIIVYTVIYLTSSVFDGHLGQYYSLDNTSV